MRRLSHRWACRQTFSVVNGATGYAHLIQGNVDASAVVEPRLTVDSGPFPYLVDGAQVPFQVVLDPTTLGAFPDQIVTVTAQHKTDGIDALHSPVELRIRGGVCDLAIDTDCDLSADGIDNCPNSWNLDQADTDLDLLGDICDPFPFDPDNDEDGDGLEAEADNCPTVANPSQGDVDMDGIGDACQCGDVSNNLVLDAVDFVQLERHLAIGAPLVAPERCNVSGSAACDGEDLVAIRLELAEFPGSVQPLCVP